jgi:hypothetical protein
LLTDGQLVAQAEAWLKPALQGRRPIADRPMPEA